MVEPLVYTGKEEVKRRAEAWFDSWRGPIRFDDERPQAFGQRRLCFLP